VQYNPLLKQTIQIISAPSILGLKPGGVENLSESLLNAGLSEKLNAKNIVNVPTLNKLYSSKRDPLTQCLNTGAIRDFSLSLSKIISENLDKDHFALTLGGDCSILIGIMPALKAKGDFGLIFLDAHADFYEPERSLTGEVADMDLAIITGRGPEILTNLNDLGPYLKDENVVHIGQRDWEETKKYGSQDIRKTRIKCIDLAEIKKSGMENAISQALQYIDQMKVEGLWIHFDTDVLSDELNPAVDYRLPGGLLFEEAESLLRSLLLTEKVVGISVTIFNPCLNKTGDIAKKITESISRAFRV
jgi:arginase